MIRYIDKTLVFFGLLAVLWILTPSSLFVRHVSTQIDGNTVTFTRETPFGTVRGRWISTISLLDGRECNSDFWAIAEYQEIPSNIVVYELGDWAADCIDIGPPYTITTYRSVMLFGFIPLRPDRTVTQVAGR